MKQLTLLLLFVFTFSLTLSAQYASVNFDLEKNYFNEGQALPAEKNLMFTGLVPPNVDIIEISIYPAKAKNDNNPLYVASWRDFDDSANTNFSIAVNYPLRASDKYDFRMDYFRKLGVSEQDELTNRLITLATSYLEANISVKGNSITLAESEKKIVRELNEIIHDALANYRTQHGTGVDNLTETIRQKLEQMEKFNLRKTSEQTTADQQQSERQTAVADKMAELNLAVAPEIQNIMDKEWSKLTTRRYIDNYETEQKKGSFSLNVGYGGVYIDGNLDDFTYGDAPYLGLSFPLGNSTLAPKFMRNSSITVGAFLDNFEDENGIEVSGFLVNRPIYLGLDYKLFEFVRFNAGATFLEKTENVMTGTNTFTEQKTVFIRPFIGLSARIDLSLSFGK